MISSFVLLKMRSHSTDIARMLKFQRPGSDAGSDSRIKINLTIEK